MHSPIPFTKQVFGTNCRLGPVFSAKGAEIQMLLVIVNICLAFGTNWLVCYFIYSVKERNELGVTIPFYRWDN